MVNVYLNKKDMDVLDKIQILKEFSSTSKTVRYCLKYVYNILTNKGDGAFKALNEYEKILVDPESTVEDRKNALRLFKQMNETISAMYR